MTEPRTLPRFADMVVSDKPARMSRRRRALVTQDGTLIVQDEVRPVGRAADSPAPARHP